LYHYDVVKKIKSMFTVPEGKKKKTLHLHFLEKLFGSQRWGGVSFWCSIVKAISSVIDTTNETIRNGCWAKFALNLFFLGGGMHISEIYNTVLIS